MLDYEVYEEITELDETSSPRSQALNNFDTYRRTELPLAVENEIRHIINTELAPIEATNRNQLEDLVRRCLSAMAVNVQISQIPASSTVDDSSTSSAPTLESQQNPSTGVNLGPSTYMNNEDTILDFFQGPLHLEPEVSATAQDLSSLAAVATSRDIEDTTTQMFSDSGYGSAGWSCACSCHTASSSTGSTGSKLLLVDWPIMIELT